MATTMSSELVDGMLLAAAAQGDGGRAAIAGLAPGLARRFSAAIRELDALERGHRHARLRATVAKLAAIPTDARLPPRAAAVLAPEVPREIGARWMASAPPVRRGFRVHRSLKTSLRRLAASEEHDAEKNERAEFSRIDRAISARLDPIARQLAPSDRERALGALALGMRGVMGGDERSRRWRAIGRELSIVWSEAWRA
jgi:hypothetical protein